MKSIALFLIASGAGLLLWSNGFSQKILRMDSTRSYFIGFKGQGGYILVNNPKLSAIKQNEPWMLQADLSVLKNEQHIWDYGGCYSKTGVSLSYIDFGNSKNLGKALSLSVFTEPILILSKKLQLTLRGSVGLSYLNKIYNADTNPDNICFSRHVSFLLFLNPNLYYSLNPRTRLTLGAQFNHISNGATQWPNWGINFVTAGVGIEYMINPQTLSPRKSTLFVNRSPKIITHIFGGQHDSDPTDTWTEKGRVVAGVNVGIVKPVTRVNGIGIGGELYYDGISKVLEAQSGKKYTSIVGSVSLQHYFFFGKLLFGQQLAYYVTKLNPNINTKVYQRYFLEYRIKGPWYMGVSLRSHGGISDYFTLSSGLVF